MFLVNQVKWIKFTFRGISSDFSFHDFLFSNGSFISTKVTLLLSIFFARHELFIMRMWTRLVISRFSDCKPEWTHHRTETIVNVLDIR